ncbi:MAG: prepilin-type N-terminal cleavage/methylation domain-containing protein [Chthonomonadetes bacterium]|nr:prepilin-type N-terminal cleavage/methylation domain-containing protein [Chthonomonadetes bacterium]
MRGRRRAFTLMEVVLSIFLLAVVAVIFGALFPIGQRLSGGAKWRAQALMLAERRMEAVKLLGYGNLTYDGLRAYGLIDASPNTSPFSFTNTDDASNESPAKMLPQGTGQIVVEDVAWDVKRVIVRVGWRDANGRTQTVELRTLVTNL